MVFSGWPAAEHVLSIENFDVTQTFSHSNFFVTILELPF
jgi:hypothetical protein